MIQLSDHFASLERNRHSHWLQQRQWFIKAKQQQAQREDVGDKLEDAVVAMAVEVTIATYAQIERFEQRRQNYEAKLDQYDAQLDIYDEAVTRALIRHVERLGLLEARHAELLAHAFMLENGTKVFKSEDGSFVIDEAGNELSKDIIDPGTVPYGYTTAEEYRSSLDQIKAERATIEALHKAQSEIDKARDASADAREKINDARSAAQKDGVTVEELDDLELEIEAAMPTGLPKLPTSASKLLADEHATNTVPDLQASFELPSDPTKLNKIDESKPGLLPVLEAIEPNA